MERESLSTLHHLLKFLSVYLFSLDEKDGNNGMLDLHTQLSGGTHECITIDNIEYKLIVLRFWHTYSTLL